MRMAPTESATESMSRWMAFFQAAAELFCVAGFDGAFKELNPAWEKTLGFSRAELRAGPLLDFVHPADRQATEAAFRRLAQGRAAAYFENRFACKDGSYRWLRWHAVPAPGEKVIYASAWDQTRLKQEEQALRSARDYYGAILQAVGDSLFVKDDAHRFLLVNDACCRFLGRERGRIVGKTGEEFFSKEQMGLFWAQDDRVMSTGREEVGEMSITDASGAARVIRVVETRYADMSGRRFAVGVFRDVTSQKLAEKQLRRAAETKAEFAAMVSHELRTPLSTLQAGISMVADGSAGPVNAQQWAFLDLALKSVNRLTRLTRDVLDFDKLEAGRLEFHFSLQNINSIVLDVVREFLPLAKEKGLDLVAELSGGEPATLCDRDKIVQVVVNLVSNAVKFSEQGRITVKTEQLEESIRVSVRDEGPGIRGEDQQRLFERFSRIVDPSKKVAGAGLGLAISRRLVEGHGGAVGVESQYGHGAVFHFLLPRKK